MQRRISKKATMADLAKKLGKGKALKFNSKYRHLAETEHFYRLAIPRDVRS